MDSIDERSNVRSSGTSLDAYRKPQNYADTVLEM